MARNRHRVAAGHPAGRVKDVEMRRAVRFRVKGALDHERTDVTAAHETGRVALHGEPELQLSMPVVLTWQWRPA
jgi:hypothetical protein